MIKQPLMIYVKLVQLQKQPFIDILILKKNYFLIFLVILERIDELRTNAKIHQNYVQQIIDAFDLIIEHMLQFKQELYCQLYISNLKENKGTFSQINDLKEIVVELIEKAQTTKEIKNPSSPQIIYNVLEHICFGCGIQWCLHQIEDVRLEFIQSLKAILIA